MAKRRKKVRNAVTSRSYRLSHFVADALAAQNQATGLSTNHLLDLAATAAFAAVHGRGAAIGDFTRLLSAAAEGRRAETRAAKITAAPRKALRAAKARLRAATGGQPTTAAPPKEPRQSA